MDDGDKKRIRIVKDGPYLVSGGVRLNEKIITPKGNQYELIDGRELTQSDFYALCRCGKSKKAPFCDGSHEKEGFDGSECAEKDSYSDRARVFSGPGLSMRDDGRCAVARFCHRNNGTAWVLVKNSDCEENKTEAIQAACECPAGRLTAINEAGKEIEPVLEPSLNIVQDPENEMSAGIFVTGNIPIESVDGSVYEIRNRTALCRCGKSRNKPFCDGTHISAGFRDKIID